MAERVFVAMSGGVDSSVAAALLVEQGYEVIGAMLRLWSEPRMVAAPGEASHVAGWSEDGGNRCCSLESVNDARAVAERLAIPFYVVNAEELFKRNVFDYFIREYAAGATPNPCLVCNRTIRFGYLASYARALDARYLATGHYARVRQDSVGRFQLCRGADQSKDQSYVLSVLGQEDLARVLFPVGVYTKAQVRALAAARSLPTAPKADSQDLCFISDGDYRGFLARWAPAAMQPGPIVDRHGRQLGVHRGLPFYTVGQRSGLGVAASQPVYVLALDRDRNALVVGPADQLERERLLTGPVNWVAGAAPLGSLDIEVQIRYRAAPVRGIVTPRPDGCAAVELARPLRGISPGQAAVFYDGEVCLGGGIIVRVH
jgi:tRNA-uridine 2-sulfurtransferase